MRLRKSRSSLTPGFHTARLKAGRQLVIQNHEKAPPVGLGVQGNAGGRKARFGHERRLESVIGRRLAVKMIAVFQGHLRVVRDYFILTGPLKKEHVTERNA